jgi:hypothetical protein
VKDARTRTGVVRAQITERRGTSSNAMLRGYARVFCLQRRSNHKGAERAMNDFDFERVDPDHLISECGPARSS